MFTGWEISSCARYQAIRYDFCQAASLHYYFYSHGLTGWLYRIQKNCTSEGDLRDGNYLLTARRFLQQFIVDVIAKIECERLQFLSREQSTLRADNYRDLRDSLYSTHRDPRNVRQTQRVIMPATFTGGPKCKLYVWEMNLLWEKNRTIFFFTLKENKKKIIDELYVKNPPDIDVYHINSK